MDIARSVSSWQGLNSHDQTQGMWQFVASLTSLPQCLACFIGTEGVAALDLPACSVGTVRAGCGIFAADAATGLILTAILDPGQYDLAAGR